MLPPAREVPAASVCTRVAVGGAAAGASPRSDTVCYRVPAQARLALVDRQRTGARRARHRWSLRMSLALQSLAGSPSSASTAADGAAIRRKADDARPDGSQQGEAAKAPKGRHALLAALTEALGGLAAGPVGNATSAPADESSPADRESKHALHAFVHELFAALRPAESEGRPGRGFAWGRTSSADLAERLDALVQRLQGGASLAT